MVRNTVSGVLLAANLLHAPAASIHVPFKGYFWDLGAGDKKELQVECWDKNRPQFIDCHPGHPPRENPAEISPGCPQGPCPWFVKTNFTIKCPDPHGHFGPCNSSMVVDFNVPGFDDPYPEPLLATNWVIESRRQIMNILEFTSTRDSTPLNHWVSQMSEAWDGRTSIECPTKVDAIFADMVNGDRKRIIIDDTSMTIQPCGNNHYWMVNTTLDEHCQAVADFQASGKLSQLPASLLMTYFSVREYHGTGFTGGYHLFQFTDPSETLATNTVPLNHWVQTDEQTCSSQSVI